MYVRTRTSIVVIYNFFSRTELSLLLFYIYNILVLEINNYLQYCTVRVNDVVCYLRLFVCYLRMYSII